ncbi:MAG: alpha-galactosidase [Clostridia bacterium]|nr:alpha-galactosidase [Clostridia bacterium]
MRIENYIDLSGRNGCSGLFFASGSFGLIDGEAKYTASEKDGKIVYITEKNGVRLTATFEMVGAVCVRRDVLENISEGEIVVGDLLSRFTLDGDDYNVYTQYSAWLHESTGDWQRLVTQIRTEAGSMRGCEGATPMMALENRYTGRLSVFHLMPSAQWQMGARKYPRMDKEVVVLEAGLLGRGLHFSLKSGEQIVLPEIIFYPAKNKTDLDAYKLHRYYNKTYPRKTLPVIYNSWMHCFDDLDIDDLKRQADTAQAMGFEAYMIDAGWFGNGDNWSRCVGDWEENLTSGPCGRLAELSAYVRERGMVFGLWFEPERASGASRSVREHPDFYIQSEGAWLLDFSNPLAVDFIYEKVASNIEKYSLGWVKFDFNDSIPIDPSGCAFYHYLAGQRRFIERLQQRFPEVYITNCASGGYRMDLHQAKFTNSLWISDNHSPLFGLDILRGTLKRMPTSCIERWNVQKYAESFPCSGYKGQVGVLFNCNNGTWDSITNVDASFAENFFIGGPMGFSCDLFGMPEEHKTAWKNAIAKYKEDREFFRTASAHILVDTDSICAIEYADETFSRIILQVYTKTVHAESIIIYPVLDENASYTYGDTAVQGRTLAEDGVLVNTNKEFACSRLDFFRKA